MARISSRNEPHRPRSRRPLIYGLGFVLLTNGLTVLFVFLLRSPRPASVAVLQAATTPAAAAASAPGVEPAAASPRQVHVTSRPTGAVVRYQGDVQGTTPVTIALPADAAGVLTLEKNGYRARSVKVNLGDTRVRVRLYHAPGDGAENTRSGARPAAGERPAPAPAPATAPRTAPASTGPAAPAPATAVPAAAANGTRQPAARPARPVPGRRTAASEDPEPWDGPERPAAGASENPGSRAD
jgi:hypothetical protein